ncbi:hypothetical protein B0H34DRAFT_716331 [Crassisporium funariophilum]|nr:hypothetical protein B0H34DRAFT_716331 [Crassisporium funariophilum]
MKVSVPPPSRPPPPMLSLGQSMDTMSLSPPPSHLPPNTDNPAIPDQIVPPVPRRPQEWKNHRVFYGFTVSRDWLITYCEQNSHRVRNYQPDNTNFTKIYLARELLASSSGIRGLEIERVLPKGYTERGGDDLDSNACWPVLVSVCSSMRSSFVNRPSKPQLEKLKSIMGGREPDWYVDAHLPEHYSED